MVMLEQHHQFQVLDLQLSHLLEEDLVELMLVVMVDLVVAVDCLILNPQHTLVVVVTHQAHHLVKVVMEEQEMQLLVQTMTPHTQTYLLLVELLLTMRSTQAVTH
jgi:hypothetical protein